MKIKPPRTQNTLKKSAFFAFSAVEKIETNQGGVNTRKVQDFLYEELSSKAIGAAIEVHKILGSGFLEAIYQEALEIEFGLQKIPFESQLELEILYKNIILKQKYKPDFIIDNKIIIEIKSAKQLTEIDKAQRHNYLKASGLKLGLLLNFGGPTLEIKRIIRSK